MPKKPTPRSEDEESHLKKLREELGMSQVAFSPNGKLVASGSADNTIRLWDLLAGKCHNNSSC